MSKLPAPHNLEAEQSVLGAVLIENTALVEIATLIEPDDFHDSRHRMIYQAAQSLQSRQVPVDLVTITTELRDAGRLEASGGASYLAELVGFVPTAANAAYYARIIRNKAIRRRVIVAAGEISGMAAGDNQDDDTLLASAMGILEGVGMGAVGAENCILTLGLLAEMYGEYQDALAGEQLPTGFPEVDGIFRGGVAPGELLTVLAYSGLGKSALLQGMALNACRKTGNYFLMFSLEMPGVRVFERSAQISTETPTYEVESIFKNRPACRERLLSDMKTAGADKLLVCDRPGLSLDQIEHLSRIAKSKFGKLCGVGIDYLGLLSDERTQSEYERVSKIARESKNLAKRLNVPVVILSQINRASASSGELEKWSCKGAGDIEAASDYMLGLQRNDRKELMLKIIKNRSGEEDLLFQVDIDWKYLKFRGVSPANAIAAKNAERGKNRTRKSFQEGPAEYDPY